MVEEEGGYLIPATYDVWENRPGPRAAIQRKVGTIIRNTSIRVSLFGDRLIRKGRTVTRREIDLEALRERIKHGPKSD